MQTNGVYVSNLRQFAQPKPKPIQEPNPPAFQMALASAMENGTSKNLCESRATTSITPSTAALRITNTPTCNHSKQTLQAERQYERDYMLKIAKADPDEAEQLAHSYAFQSLGFALLDISDEPNIRYSATGELVTPKTQQYFNAVSQAMQQQCAQLYRQEKENGTPDAEILEKIFNFHDTMPEAFKGMLAI